MNTLTQHFLLNKFKVIPPKEETRHTLCHYCQQYGHEQILCPNKIYSKNYGLV